MILVQLTDLHVRPEGMAAYRVAETNMLTERAFRAVAGMKVKPDAVVISGDLTDNGLVDEYRVLADMLRCNLGHVPVYLIPGNHDRRDVMRAELGTWPGVNSDPDLIQYTVETLPVRLVLLDTLVPGAGHGELSPKSLIWLDTVLRARPSTPTIVVMHHPPFICGISHMDSINLRNSTAFAEVIGRHPQVERILCGHHHRPITARVGGTIASICPSVAHQVELELRPGAPGLFVMEPAAFQIHIWNAAAGIVSHMGYVEAYPGPYPFVTDPAYPGK